MPPRKRPSKEDIKRAADRAEGKKPKTKAKPSPLDPLVQDEDEELEEMPGGVTIPLSKSRRGRPRYKYIPQYAIIAAAMRNKGATTFELADVFGISERTIWKWRAMYPEFDAAFGALGQEFDSKIESRLSDRAMGFYYPVTKPMIVKGNVVMVEYEEYALPDVGAIKQWLAARLPDRWRLKDEVEISTDAEAFIKIWQSMGGRKNKEAKT